MGLIVYYIACTIKGNFVEKCTTRLKKTHYSGSVSASRINSCMKSLVIDSNYLEKLRINENIEEEKRIIKQPATQRISGKINF